MHMVKNWNWKCNNDTKKIDSGQIHLNRWPGDITITINRLNQ